MTKIIAPPGAPQAQLHQVRWPYFQPQQQATSRPCTTQTMAYSRHYTMYQPTSWSFHPTTGFLHLHPPQLNAPHLSRTPMSSTPPSFSFRGQELQLPASLKVSEPRQVTSALVRLSSTHFDSRTTSMANPSIYGTAHKAICPKTQKTPKDRPNLDHGRFTPLWIRFTP